VPHYHILFAVKPSAYLPIPDKSGLWVHGSSRVSKRKNMENKPFYIAKYVSKLGQKTEFPKGFRIFGVYIKKGLLSEKELWQFRMTNYPKWLVRWMVHNGFEGQYPRRAEGGGWLVDAKYGVVVVSDWVSEGMPSLVDEAQIINRKK
jgi:hypothetical protein